MTDPATTRDSALDLIEAQYAARLKANDEEYARSVEIAAAIRRVSDLRATNERRLAMSKAHNDFELTQELAAS